MPLRFRTSHDPQAGIPAGEEFNGGIAARKPFPNLIGEVAASRGTHERSEWVVRAVDGGIAARKPFPNLIGEVAASRGTHERSEWVVRAVDGAITATH